MSNYRKWYSRRSRSSRVSDSPRVKAWLSLSGLSTAATTGKQALRKTRSSVSNFMSRTRSMAKTLSTMSLTLPTTELLDPSIPWAKPLGTRVDMLSSPTTKNDSHPSPLMTENNSGSFNWSGTCQKIYGPGLSTSVLSPHGPLYVVNGISPTASGASASPPPISDASFRSMLPSSPVQSPLQKSLQFSLPSKTRHSRARVTSSNRTSQRAVPRSLCPRRGRGPNSTVRPRLRVTTTLKSISHHLTNPWTDPRLLRATRNAYPGIPISRTESNRTPILFFPGFPVDSPVSSGSLTRSRDTYVAWESSRMKPLPPTPPPPDDDSTQNETYFSLSDPPSSEMTFVEDSERNLQRALQASMFCWAQERMQKRKAVIEALDDRTRARNAIEEEEEEWFQQQAKELARPADPTTTSVQRGASENDEMYSREGVTQLFRSLLEGPASTWLRRDRQTHQVAADLLSEYIGGGYATDKDASWIDDALEALATRSDCF